MKQKVRSGVYKGGDQMSVSSLQCLPFVSSFFHFLESYKT